MMSTDTTTLRRAIASLLLVSAVLFAIGAIAERAGGESAHAEVVHETRGDHDESPTEAARQVTSEVGGASESASEGTVLGVDVESTVAIVAALVGSIALALAVVAVHRRWVFVAVGVFAIGLAVLDLAEVVYQVNREAAGLAIVTALVAGGHLTAGALSARPPLTTRRPEA